MGVWQLTIVGVLVYIIYIVVKTINSLTKDKDDGK